MSIREAVEILGKIKVLHFDDNELFMNTIKQSLESQNNRILVESVINSVNLFNKIKENYYDCILLNYFLPLSNGLEISDKIKEISDIPIILYTDKPHGEIPELIKNKSVEIYLQKELGEINYINLENTIIRASEKYRSIKILEKITNNKNDYFLVINKKHNIVYYNNAFQKYLNEFNLLGESLFELVENEYKKELFDFINNTRVHKLNGVIINYKNNIKYIEVQKYKIHNKSEYMLLFFRDLNTNIVNEDINYTSDIRFNAISKLSADAIITISQFGYVTYINNAFSALTGFSKDEIIGKHVISLPTLRNRNISSITDLLKQVIKGDLEEIEYDFPYTKKDGTSGIGNAIARIIKVKGKRELISIIKDVTTEKQIGEEYKNIFESSPDGIIHLNMDGNIKNINKSALNILNIDADNFLGKNIFDLEKDIVNKGISFKEIYETLLLGKDISSFEIQLDVKNMEVWVEVKVTTIKSLEEPLGIQILLKDITQRKKIEQERIIYTENLEKLVEDRTNQIMDNEKMFTLAKVTSMIGHDLKGPLQVISNSLHLIKMRPENKEQYIGYIQKAVEQSNDLIKEMQEIGKDSPLKIEKSKIEDIIEESLLQIKTSENINFEIDVQIDEFINIDKSKFIRVFNNLFKNAIEAMPEGGKISVLAMKDCENIIFEICDSGLGIPKEKIKDIFRPFQSSKRKGMGLGLNFCKNTVEAHGGKIKVYSELGKGTKFTIIIPKDIKIK